MSDGTVKGKDPAQRDTAKTFQDAGKQKPATYYGAGSFLEKLRTIEGRAEGSSEVQRISRTA
jgi:hypothetical protein